MSIEKMKLALEALEANQPVNYCMNNNGEKFPMMQEDPFKFERNTKAITSLRQAIAEAEQANVSDGDISQDHVAETEKKRHESVTCTHKWFRTGAMKPGEARCIDCGAWNNTSPQRKPLTDEEIGMAFRKAFPVGAVVFTNGAVEFARAIEAAHGIKG